MVNERLLSTSVGVHGVWCRALVVVRERAKAAWRERHSEVGLDEAVTKMIWLAVGIVVALAATAFFVSTFNQAKDSVPDPVGP